MNSLSPEDIAKLLESKPVAVIIIRSLGNQHPLQTIISGLTSGYEGIEPIIVGTAVISTKTRYTPTRGEMED